MIFGVGIDTIEVDRVKKQVDNSSFKEKIFTTEEIEYCDSKHNYAQSYAARFAAKEAFFKAIGTGWRGGMAFNEIEITNNELGKPDIKTYGKVNEFIRKNRLDNIHVSLTHLQSFASAVVIIEKAGDKRD